MIFAAGLGTRLRPLTNDRPKAMVEVNGVPMLKHAIDKLIAAGVDDVVINVHHFAEQIIEYAAKNNNFGISVSISDESDELMNTGGGLKKAAQLLRGNEPILVMNVDVISDIDLLDICDRHLKSNALATLAVKKRSTSRYLLFNDDDCLCGWKNVKTGELKEVSDCTNAKEMAFSGIQVLSPQIFDYMEEFDGAFSSIDLYLHLAKMHKIVAYDHSCGRWMDLGKYEEIELANQMVELLGKDCCGDL